MNKYQTFENFLTTNVPDIPILGFVFNLILAVFLSYILKTIYVKFGKSLSNREKFGSNFFLLTSTTMLIITIVKSSLALSLGLVGALSIIRFRAAIKEPEELTYLFLAIAIGLGMGANQVAVTLVGSMVIFMILILKNKNGLRDENEPLLLLVESNSSGVSVENVSELLANVSNSVKVKRINIEGDLKELSFLIDLKDINSLNETTSKIKELDSSAKISYLDYSGII